MIALMRYLCKGYFVKYKKKFSVNYKTWIVYGTSLNKYLLIATWMCRGMQVVILSCANYFVSLPVKEDTVILGMIGI